MQLVYDTDADACCNDLLNVTIASGHDAAQLNITHKVRSDDGKVCD